MKKALVAVAVVAAILAGLFHLLKTPQGPIVLACRFKANETTRYKVRVKTKMNSQWMYGPGSRGTQIAHCYIVRKVLKVGKDGSARVRMSCYSRGGYGGMPMPYPYGRIDLRVSRTGVIGQSKQMAERLSYGGPMSMEFVPTGVLGSCAVLPDHGIGVGQTWNESVPFPTGGGELNVTSTLVSDRHKLGKRIVCKIENRYEGTIDLGQVYKKLSSRRMGFSYPSRMEVSGKIDVSGRGTIYFSRSEGRIIRHDDKTRVESTTVQGNKPGSGGSSTGASITYQAATEVESRAVLVEERKKGGVSGVPPSP